jgi:hypothetical protein
MTWQRIDENTYIDDTLVTCAEYQLFIDEMLEQGKYYQPDHWTSYQFLKGQAKEPIFGMRPSDAAAFCDWLTKQDNKQIFRLPFPQEAQQYTVQSSLSQPIGYWVDSKEDKSFIWNGTVPQNPRDVPYDFDITRASDRDLNDALNIAINRDLSVSHQRDTGIAYIIKRIGLERVDTYARILNIDIIYAQISAADLAFLDLDLGLDLNRNAPSSFNVYIDIFTLRERIARRSPAFEGIRLVKERMR